MRGDTGMKDMSVLIKGMEMPTNCDALLHIHSDGRAVLYPFGASGEVTEYQAIPVPPHGRLIDADALLKGCERTGNEYVTREWAFSQSAIENAPTIIPASGKQ